MIRTTIRGIRLASLMLAGYWLLLFVATHIPAVPMPDVVHSDKLVHAVAFAGLAFLMAWAIPTFVEMRWLNAVIALIATICYGAFDELSQTPVGRTADLLDWAADSLGAVLGIIIYLIMRRLIVMLYKSRPAKQPMTLEVPLA